MRVTQDSLTARLALHPGRDAPQGLRTRARLFLLDWLECMAGGRGSQLTHQVPGDGLARAIRPGNVLEMDGVHRRALLHPGPVIWPTVLVCRQGSLEAALTAAIRGHGASICVGSLLDGAHHGFWHTTAIAGVFAAAAAAAIQAGADTDTLTAALELAGTMSGGLWQMRHGPGEGKQWHPALAVTTGLQAARHALAGISGPPFIRDGPRRLAATCRTLRALMLTPHWRLTESGFKPWGGCRHTHPAVTAALALRAAGHLQGPMCIHTYWNALTFWDHFHPETVLQAKFSPWHAMEAVCARGEPQRVDFEPATSSGLSALWEQVTVEEAPGLAAAYPVLWGAEVSPGGGALCPMPPGTGGSFRSAPLRAGALVIDVTAGCSG